MKHPFYTLYYTGLAILLSLSSLIFLFGYNFSNVLYHLTEKKKEQTNYNEEINPVILETKIPKTIIETKVTQLEKPVNVPPKQQSIVVTDSGTTENVENIPLQPKSEGNKDTTIKTP